MSRSSEGQGYNDAGLWKGPNQQCVWVSSKSVD